jgi:hypothetical protein
MRDQHEEIMRHASRQRLSLLPAACAFAFFALLEAADTIGFEPMLASDQTIAVSASARERPALCAARGSAQSKESSHRDI